MYYIINVECLASVFVFVCLSWEQRFVYVFKVCMKNIMVKSAKRQLYLRTYILPITDFLRTSPIYVLI